MLLPVIFLGKAAEREERERGEGQRKSSKQNQVNLSQRPESY